MSGSVDVTVCIPPHVSKDSGRRDQATAGRPTCDSEAATASNGAKPTMRSARCHPPGSARHVSTCLTATHCGIAIVELPCTASESQERAAPADAEATATDAPASANGHGHSTEVPTARGKSHDACAGVAADMAQRSSEQLSEVIANSLVARSALVRRIIPTGSSAQSATHKLSALLRTVAWGVDKLVMGTVHKC